MQLAINDATAAAATATETTPKSRAAMDKDDQGPATSDDTEDERRERERERERESENERRRKALGRAGRTGRKTGPGRQTTLSPLQDRAGLPRAGPGSLTTTKLDGSTNCQPPGWAVARLISCCPARKPKCSFARLKQHPPAHHPLDGCLLLLC